VKNFITLFLLCFSIAGFAQAGKNVEKNVEKIDELNQRLDNLLGTSKSISGDSVGYKLDLLFLKIQELKSEMKSIRLSVEEIKDNGVPNSDRAKLDKINSRFQEIESGKYYVVLASERTKVRAERFISNYKHTQKIRMVKNLSGTWFHIIIDQPQAMKDAIETTSAVRNKEVKDAWFVNGKKLTEI